MNFKQYSDYYIDNILSMKKPASQASMRSHIRRAVKSFGKIKLDRLTGQMIQKHISLVSTELSAKSVQTYWSTIKNILNRARLEGFTTLVVEPELPKVFKLKQPYLTKEEMRSIILAGSGKFKLLAELLAETGCRIGEALALRPSDVNLEKSTLSITRSLFNGKEQQPKSENAIREISISYGLATRLHTDGTDFIFLRRDIGRNVQRNNQNCRRLLQRVLTKLTIGVRGFHAFRRGNASLMASLGVPEHIIRYRLGHAGGVTAGYIQTPVGTDKRWSEKIANSIK